MPLQLTGEKVILQEFTADHLSDPLYITWLRDLEVVSGIYRLDYLLPLEEGKIRAYAEGLMASTADYFFSVCATGSGEFIGTIKLGHIDWRTGSGDLGILIGNKAYWGKGIATDAVRTFCRYGFKTLSLRKITGGTAASNFGMIRCFEKCGFKQEGSLRKKLLIEGEYIDHVLFGLLAEEFEG